MIKDKSLFPVVCFGETLWDVFPNGREPGGAPMNVAFHLSKLQKNPAMISKVGLDDLGKQLIELLEARQLCTDYFQVDYQYKTGVVYTKAGEENEVVYDIIQQVAWDNIQWENIYEELLQNAGYLVYGSLSARCKTSRETLLKLLEAACIKVLDINLRAPFYNREIIEQLLSKATILKLNLAELELITGWFSPYSNETDRLKVLKNRFGLETIILTKGSSGAVLNIGDHYYSHPGYSVDVTDTVGSGDAFLAAIISGLIDGTAPGEALDFANRLAAFISTCKGACPDYQLTDIDVVNVLKPSSADPKNMYSSL